MPRITATVRTGARTIPADFHDMNPYTVTLCNGKRRMTVPFFTGRGWKREPTAADVLSCLLSDAAGVECAGSFESWAGDYGYDTDSRKALDTFKACERTLRRLRVFLGAECEEALASDHEAWAAKRCG